MLPHTVSIRSPQSHIPNLDMKDSYASSLDGTKLTFHSASLASTYLKNSYKRAHSPDSLKDFALSSTQKTIAKLNAEISKLQAIVVFTRAELAEQLSNQSEEMFKALEEEEQKYLNAQRRLLSVRDEIKTKEEYAVYVKRRTESKEEELRYVEEERCDLERRLNHVSSACDEQQMEAERLGDEASELLESMTSILAQQEIIASSSVIFEKKMEHQSTARMDTLRSMLDAEMRFRQQSTQLRVMNNGKRLTDSIIEEKQKTKSIIDSITQDMEDNCGEISSSSQQLLLLS